jgi:hypothetical protein
MKSLLKIEYLLIAFYLLLILAAALALFYFRVNDRLAMPVFIGLFSVAPFVIYFPAANRISPRVCKIFLVLFAVLSVLFFVPALNFSICLPIPLLIVFMFIIKRERRIGYENWLKTNKFSPVPTVSGELLDALGREKNWSCYANSFFPANGREVPFLMWFGYHSTSVTTYVNNVPTRTTALVPHVAMSFFPGTVSENFKQTLEALDVERQSFLDKLLPGHDMKYPYKTTRLADGTFIAAWSILHVPSILDEKMSEIKSLLEKMN